MNRSLVRPAACALAAAAFTLILLAVPASSPSAQITLSGFGCSGTVSWSSASNTLTCATSGGTFGCSSISASPSSTPLLTQAVTLTANCSNNVGSIAYTWTASGANAAGCPSIGSGASQEILAVPTATSAVNCTYNLSAFDTATTATTSKMLSYSVSPPPPPPPGSVDTSACTALGLTPKVITAAWTGNTVLYTSSAGNFGPNDAIIVQFTTSSVTTSTSSGSISAVQYVDPDTSRSFVLSDKPCDFTGGLNLYKMKGTPAVLTQCKNLDGSAQKSAATGSINPQNGFTVANAGTSCNPILDAGRTYFWSMTNFSPPPGVAGSTQQCNLSHCNMIMFLTKPSGT
jgi:hypothetical protein